MSKEVLHGLIGRIPVSDANTIYNVLLKLRPADKPENDKLKAIAFGRQDSFRRRPARTLKFQRSCGPSCGSS